MNLEAKGFFSRSLKLVPLIIGNLFVHVFLFDSLFTASTISKLWLIFEINRSSGLKLKNYRWSSGIYWIPNTCSEFIRNETGCWYHYSSI